MFQKSILVIGAFAAIGASFMTVPARAEGFDIFKVFGLHEPEAVGGMRSAPVGASVRHVGAPGWQRGRNGWVVGPPGTRVAVADLGFPYAGPNRHTVCGWQDRFDRRERYVGSQRICWTEAR